LRPLYDALEEFLPTQKLATHPEDHVIEIVSLASMTRPYPELLICYSGWSPKHSGSTDEDVSHMTGGWAVEPLLPKILQK